MPRNLVFRILKSWRLDHIVCSLFRLGRAVTYRSLLFYKALHFKDKDLSFLRTNDVKDLEARNI